MTDVQAVAEAQAGLATLSQWIDRAAPNANRDAEAALWGRVSKITEEAGEAIAALIGLTGQNPRKGVTHSREDLVEELLDVAVTALGAVEHVTGNGGRSLPLLIEAIGKVCSRAGVTVEALRARDSGDTAEIERLRQVEREHTEDCGRFVECGGDGRTCQHPVTLVDNENTVPCVWCQIERLRDGGDTVTVPKGADLIAIERQRQINEEGWTPEHDAEHVRGELADAAALYIAMVQYSWHGDALSGWRTAAQSWIKRDDPDNVRMLVKAGALIAAEIDRLLGQECEQ